MKRERSSKKIKVNGTFHNFQAISYLVQSCASVLGGPLAFISWPPIYFTYSSVYLSLNNQVWKFVLWSFFVYFVYTLQPFWKLFIYICLYHFSCIVDITLCPSRIYPQIISKILILVVFSFLWFLEADSSFPKLLVLHLSRESSEALLRSKISWSKL